MAISTLAELKTQVKSFLMRANILDVNATDNIENLILLGEKWIFRRCRAREMETALAFTIASGEGTVPSDYRALKHARITGSPTRFLRQRKPQWIYENYPLRSSNSKPFWIGVDGSVFVFGPYPDSNYSVVGYYYAALTSVLSSANALFAAHPDLYLFAALAETETYIKNDKRVAMWLGKRDAILRDINAEKEEGEQGQSMEVMIG